MHMKQVFVQAKYAVLWIIMGGGRAKILFFSKLTASFLKNEPKRETLN